MYVPASVEWTSHQTLIHPKNSPLKPRTKPTIMIHMIRILAPLHPINHIITTKPLLQMPIHARRSTTNNRRGVIVAAVTPARQDVGFEREFKLVVVGIS